MLHTHNIRLINPRAGVDMMTGLLSHYAPYHPLNIYLVAATFNITHTMTMVFVEILFHIIVFCLWQIYV